MMAMERGANKDRKPALFAASAAMTAPCLSP